MLSLIGRVIVVAVLLMPAQVASAAGLDVPRACAAAIDAQLPRWRLSPPPTLVARGAKGKNISTNIVQADFDADRTRDTAVLLLAADHDQDVPYLAVCLTAKNRVQLHLIREPYCRDGIVVVPKGTKAHDYETDKVVTYRTNGIHAYCAEVAGGTYIYDTNRFRLVVDSD